MKRAKLAMLAVLVLGVTQAAGCIISSDDDDETVVFRATWELSDPAGPTTCEAQGVDKVSFLFTGDNNMGYDEIFSCSDGSGDTNPEPLQGYTFVASAVGLDGRTLGMSDSLDTAAGSCATSCDVDLPTVEFAF